MPAWITDVATPLIAVIALFVSIRNRQHTNALAAESNEIARNALALAQEQADRYGVPWVLTHVRGSMYRLRNTSNEIAWWVTVAGVNVDQGAFRQDAVDGRSAVEFSAVVALDSPRGEVLVTWHRLQNRTDEQLRWTSPLPSPS